MDHPSTDNLTSESQSQDQSQDQSPYYLVTDSDLEYLYKCAALIIYIFVLYMVYYYYELCIKIIACIMLTYVVLFHMVKLFKTINQII